MILVCCVDDGMGMLFNRRRQSRDRAVRQDLLALAAGRPVWMNAYSAGQFEEPYPALRVEEDFLARAGAGELCFLEDRPAAPWADRVEQVVLYRWNRVYPADLRFDLTLAAPLWRLDGQTEFAGTSHEKITREVYVREN